MTTAERLRNLADRVSAELAVPGAQRDSGAEDPGLQGVARALRLAAERLEAGDRAGGVREAETAAVLVGDSWSTRSSLGAEVLQVAQALRRA